MSKRKNLMNSRRNYLASGDEAVNRCFSHDLSARELFANYETAGNNYLDAARVSLQLSEPESVFLYADEARKRYKQAIMVAKELNGDVDKESLATNFDEIGALRKEAAQRLARKRFWRDLSGVSAGSIAQVLCDITNPFNLDESALS